MKQKADFVGTWKLIEFKIYLDNPKQEISPYGDSPIGYLIYTEDNYVSVHFMRKNRLECSSEDYKETTTAEKIEIADGYGGYVGTYEITDSAIIHYPEVCTFPNFIQKPQRREFSFYRNTLVLQCPYTRKNSETSGTSKITWERVSPTSHSYAE